MYMFLTKWNKYNPTEARTRIQSLTNPLTYPSSATSKYFSEVLKEVMNENKSS